MKILGIEQTIFEIHSESVVSFSSYPDTSLLRNNDNFYIPNFSDEITAQIGIYCNLSKIGKHITPQFITRYYKEFGIAINFVAADKIRECKLLDISTDFARGFDHSFAISNQLIPTEQLPLETAEFSVQLNDKEYTFSCKNEIQTIHSCMSHSSSYFTFKIGDFFFLPCLEIVSPIHKSDIFDIFVQQTHMLHCEVK